MVDLSGLSILVVEDEYLIALDMVDCLEEIGARIIGPFGSVQEALDGLHVHTVDAAILDVNLRGEKVFKVAEHLEGRGIPYVFTTGYDGEALPERHRSIPRIEKPVRPQDVIRALFPAG